MPFDNQSYKDPVKWVKSDFPTPSDALVGGLDLGGELLYIGRVEISGNLIPGKVGLSRKVCHVAYGGKEERRNIYEILVAEPECDVQWVSAHNGCLPVGAIQGGHTDRKEPLFIGRAHYNGSLVVGKVHPLLGICQISLAGAEIPCREYEVLVARTCLLV